MSKSFRASTGLAIATAFFLVACTPPGPSTQKAAESAGPVAGHVNGQVVRENLLEMYAQKRFKKGLADLSPEQLKQSQDDFVRLIALAQEAERLGFDNDPEIALQNLSALAQILVRNHVEANPITEDIVKARFEERLNSGEAREYKARHILLETEEDAQAVIGELDGGADFVELAKTQSTGPSASKGGDLGWFGVGRMAEPFWVATTNLESGKYSTEPVKTDFGFHVILLEQTRDRPFAEAEPQLRGELQRDLVEDFVSALTDSAQVNWETAVSQ